MEFANDEEKMVRMEGIGLMTEFLSVFKKQKIESHFISDVDKAFKYVLDTATIDEFRVKITELSGKILDKLSHCHLAHKYEEMFLEFFREVIRDKNNDVKMKALYNLPCFV